MISVLGLSAAIERHREFDALISIENADGNLHEFRIEEGRPQLVLAFNDIDFDDGSAQVALRNHVSSAVRFARNWQKDCSRLLVHCHAGRCRSPAIALGIIADRLGPGREEEAVDQMLEIVPRAAPNLLVLKLADLVLERGGKLEAAWLDRYEHGDEVIRLRRLKREIYERKRRGEA